MAESGMTTDMVMKFVGENGTKVDAECLLEKALKDNLMDGFNPQDPKYYSNFFAVTKFNFGVAVKEEDASKQKEGKGEKTGEGKTKKNQGVFASWRSNTDDQVKATDYPLETDQFSVSRTLDAASITFFQACCNTRTFDSATLVKRISTGSRRSLTDNGAPRGYFRIDFKKVLITGVAWDDGDVLSETTKFICKSFELQYLQQDPNGSLGAPNFASWDQERDARQRGSGSSSSGRG